MLQRADPSLVLASASASRRALLAGAGLNAAIVPSSIDETPIKRDAWAHRVDAETTALRLADAKAESVALARPDAIVIGADQILVCDDIWFDKPVSPEAARDQLLRLRGREHRLATAATCYHGGRRVWHHVASPRLVMRRFSDSFLDVYLTEEGAAVTTSVGAYRLEGRGIHLFSHVEGEHATILGLPLLALLAFLRDVGALLD